MAEQNPRSTGSRAGRTVLDVIRKNPAPIALIGVGVGWLVATNRPGSSRGRSRAASQRGAAYGMVARGRNAVGELAGAAQHTAGDLVERGRNAAGYVTEHAHGQAERAKDSFKSAISENPLVVGTVALAAGAIVAALIPHTDAENRLMGEARDTFVESAQGAAQEALAQVREKTEQLATEAAKNLDQLH